MATQRTTKKTSNKKIAAKPEESKLLQGLNPAQEQAVNFGEGPLLIVAGAGTGKTTVITRRIAKLIAQGVKPDEILALTFTEKAAAEMEERVDLLVPYGYYDFWISTFHAFCERVLKQYALDIGISNDFKLLDPVQQWLLVRQNLDQFDLDYYRPLGNPTKFIGAMIKHFGKLKDEEISPEEYLEFAQKQKLDKDNPEFDTDEEIKRVNELANAYHTYQRLLLENNSLDFGDLINYTLQLFRKRKNVLAHFQKKFKFILVDEFQDTNYAQYELIKLLAAPKNNLTVVGDDDQSIYKFRGASVSNILQFKKDFKDTQEITLTENYRSSQNILDIAYNFIQANNPDRLEPKLGINKKLISAIKEKGIVEVLSGQTLSDEVDLVTKKIVSLQKEGASWNDFAILVRANDQADPFVAKMAASGIPYTFFANKGLYRKPIIVDLISYLRLLNNFHDSMLMYRVINFPVFKIDPHELMTILNYAHMKTLSTFEALEQVAAIPGIKQETLKKANEIVAMLKKHCQEASEKHVVEVFINIVRDLKIAKRVQEDTLENYENRELLEQFYKKIESFESESTDKTVKAFLENLTFEQEAGEEGKLNFDPNLGPESVKVLTIHSSKGLEFKHVFVVNMVHLRFPSVDRKEAIEVPKELIKEILPEGDIHLQEERRLFYVAMTRAKRGLYFSYAYDYGGSRAKKPSQFLVDIGLVAKPLKSMELERKPINAVTGYVDPNLFLPTKFSFTQINDFWKCPMRYKYRYLLHLPLKGNHHLSFGNTIHASLEKFLTDYRDSLNRTQLDLFEGGNKPKLPNLDDLLKLYEHFWVDQWYRDKKQKEGFRERGKQILKSFYEEFKKEPIAPKYLEKSFRLKLGDFDFTGKIDRADLLPDGTLRIIDYKTGESKLDKSKEDRYQLLIYQWAAEECFKEKVSSMSYWYLYDNTFSESTVGSPEEIDDLRGVLLEAANQIRAAVINNNFKDLDSQVRHECEFEDFN